MTGGDKSREDELLFRIVTLFFKATKPADIWKELQPDFPTLTRESIYPKLAKAVERGLVRLVPPVENELACQIKERFPQCRTKDIRVVKTRGRLYNEAVSATAADVAFDLLRDLGSKGYSEVGLGLGPGKATLDFARSLSARIEEASGIPPLDLFAITAGCIPTAPEFAPLSFFNLFPNNRVRRRVALFAETLVPVRDFAEITARVGVQEAFAAKKDIRLIVTALGDSTDEHDLLSTFLRAADRSAQQCAADGNVQYRPFNAEGPSPEQPDDLRAVTLFELDELVKLCGQKDSYVILISRQCGLCGMHKARVSFYLLERDDLRVFSHLVLDLPTADALLA